MKTKLSMTLATLIASTAVFANTTVTVDEMSNSAPKTTIVVEKPAAKEVALPKETVVTPKLEAVKTEVKNEIKTETVKAEPVKVEEIDKELAEINPDVKPEPLPNIFETNKTEDKKEVVKTEAKAETKTPTLTATTDDSLDLRPVQTEVQLPVKETKKVRAPKVKAPVYEEEIAYEKPMSASEQIRAYRQKMEERNVLQLQKKIEEIRIRQELALARKLQESMNQTIKAIDSI